MRPPDLKANCLRSEIDLEFGTKAFIDAHSTHLVMGTMPENILGTRGSKRF